MIADRLDGLVETVESATYLDRPGDVLASKVQSVLLARPRVRSTLAGTPLGHPLHPMLTDVTIGMWTSAWLLDLVGPLRGHRRQTLADAFIAAGLITAVPTIASGLADWSSLAPGRTRRLGLFHGGLMAAGVVGYAWSLRQRLAGRRVRGVLTANVTAAVLTAGGYLGGHLAFRRGVGVDFNARTDEGGNGQRDGGWRRIDTDLVAGLAIGQPAAANVDGEPVVVVRDLVTTRVLADRCSHMGGPLHEGDVSEGCIRCPWHASRFRLEDGSVAEGPATAPQPTYAVDVADDKTVLVRRRPWVRVRAHQLVESVTVLARHLAARHLAARQL